MRWSGCRLPIGSARIRAFVPPHRNTRFKRSLLDLATARASWGDRLRVSEEVEHALIRQEPIIALESAIITHGMPYPTNKSTAQSLESIIRSHSVTPATIALIDGHVHIGLTEPERERLSDPEQDIGRKVKVSRRDLAGAMSMGLMGGTTVAGTSYIARSVGLEMFVTGGIGGVHRGAEKTFDISADLIELGRTPLAVICAGAKSILDIPLTLEVLETQGICVATYGPTTEFPAFYSPRSGSRSPWNVEDPKRAAKLIHTGLTLPSPLSTLLGVPIPSEHSEAGERVQKLVEQAIKESQELGIKGNEATPWLLKRVGELSGGETLRLNIALIENNARVGAEIALELSKVKRENDHHRQDVKTYTSPPTPSPTSSVGGAVNTSGVARPPPSSMSANLPAPEVVVFGSAAIDVSSTSTLSIASSQGSTTPGHIRLTPGGVGRNIAESAQNLLPPHSVQLVSAIGSTRSPASTAESITRSMEEVIVEERLDPMGVILMDELDKAGLRTDGLKRVIGGQTSACSLILDERHDLVAGIADMDIVHQIDGDWAGTHIRDGCKMVAFDCNISPEIVSHLLSSCHQRSIPTFCDPTSTPKISRLLPALTSLLPPSATAPRPLTHLSPNVLELTQLHNSLTSLSETNSQDIAWQYINSLNLDSTWRSAVETFTRPDSMRWIRDEGLVQQMVACLPYVSTIWLKASHRGLLHLRITNNKPTTNSRTSSNSFWRKLPSPHDGYLALTLYPAVMIPESEIVSTTGAGDTLVGGLIAGLVSQEGDEAVWVGRAMDRAVRTIKSHRAVG